MFNIHKTDRDGITTEVKLDTPTKVMVVGSVMCIAAVVIVALVHFVGFLATL